MAEIKSTLELALEKTKNISISQEEKEEIKRKEILLKASGMFNRYLEDYLSAGDMVREIERMEGKAGTLIREALLSRSIDAISLDDRNESLLKAIESLKGRGVDEVKRELASLRSQYEREEQEAVEKIVSRMEETLRQDGISGSAVVPHVHGSSEWKETIERLHQSFRGRIEEIREVLRKL